MRNTLSVNPIACDGRGLCAELFPERIRLDEWGYPLIEPGPVPAALEGHALRAVSACPMLALRLVKQPKQARRRKERA
jgi:ferredoxin